MRWRFFRRRVPELNALFNGHFIEPKAFYATQFKQLPCVHFIGELEAGRAFAFVRERYQNSVGNIYQHSWYNHEEGRMNFNNTILLLDEDRLIEFGADYCQLLFRPDQYNWANQLIQELVPFRKAVTREARVVGFARDTATNLS